MDDNIYGVCGVMVAIVENWQADPSYASNNSSSLDELYGRLSSLTLVS